MFQMDRPQFVYATTAMLSLFFLNLVEVRPNRIASGVHHSAWNFLGPWAFLLMAGFIFMAALSFIKDRRRSLISALIGALLFVLLFSLLGIMGSKYVKEGSAGRITLSSGCYMVLLMLYLLSGHAAKEDGRSRAVRVMGGLGAAVVIIMIFLGHFSDFSLMKEYAVKADQFSRNVRTHFFLSLGSAMAGTITAVPLGYLVYRKKRLERVVMVPLSIIETIPSLSLFGILLVPLAGLGRISFFRSLGISGIGWAPAFVALYLYTLLPIGRNALVGFLSVDRDVIEAAEGMGMDRRQILFKIIFPLALPMVVTGIRIALVQALGGAVLAGLVGGGGLGTFVFLGLAEGSPDLVLLGVIPIIFLTLTLDGLLKRVIVRLGRRKL